MWKRVVGRARIDVRIGLALGVAALLPQFAALAQSSATPPVAATSASSAADDPDARPPVTQADLLIVNRAGELLDSPSKCNRADNRKCPADARTYSL